MPRLSVVIPTFNTAPMTNACCRAVLASMPEVIVVDDGSTDGTADSLPSGVKVVRLEVNRGFAVAANRGVAEATGDVILLLNSDAVVQPGALQALLDAFERDPRLGVAGARLLNEDGTAQWSGGRTPTLPWMIGAVTGLGRFARFFRRGNGKPANVDWVSGAAMAFRRDVWRDAGPLNEHFLFYCQDIEFCLEAAKHGWGVRIVEDARVVHGLGKTVGKAKDKLRADLLTWGRSHYGRAWWLVARMVL